MRIKNHVLPFLIIICYISQFAVAQNRYFKHWPENSDPIRIGLRLTQHFIDTPHPGFTVNKPPKKIIYPEVCTWYGALKFAQAAHNKELKTELENRFLPLLTEEKQLVPEPDHVDHTVFGSIPLMLYMQTKNPAYFKYGIRYADAQWQLPANEKSEYKNWARKGFSWQTRMWIDDMYMISLVQAQAYRASHDTTYLNRAAHEMVHYLNELQRPNGLFYHAPDVPFFWGRGNGWMAAGMTEILTSLPPNHPDRAQIMKGYRKMMTSLLQFQTADGMWRQLIDDKAAWEETSATGMFTYAFITGVKKGWLPEATYGPAARKAWLTLVGYINENDDVTAVCEGTNKKNNRQYYLDRKRHIGDMHGQAPVLWCAFALLESN